MSKATEIIKKKKSSVSVKMYLDLKRKFVKSEKEKNRYKIPLFS